MSGRNVKDSGIAGKKASASTTEEQPSVSRVRKNNEEPSEMNAKRPKTTDENSAAVEKLVSTGNNVESSNGSPSLKSILALNEFCWIAIFSYLSLRDQLKLAGSNRNIYEIYKSYIRHRYRHIDERVTSNIDETDLAHLLELMCENVVSYESPLDPQIDGEQHMWLLRTYTAELKHLKMTFRRPHSRDLLSLRQLTSLHARLHFGNPESCTKFVSNLVHLPCLRKLILEAPNYNGDGLHVLENLESLEIGAYPGFDAEKLAICCLKMQRLRHLNVGKYIDNLTAENFRLMVRNCHHLERLAFGEHLLELNVPYEIISQLPRLKHVQLWHSGSIKADFIERLINKRGDPLESLVLIGNELRTEQVEHLCHISSLRELHVACHSVPLESLLKLENIEYLHINMPDITNAQLMELLKGYPLLSVLSVQNCNLITSEFVRDATRFWKQTRSRSNLIKVVYLQDSSVNWSSVQMFNDDKVIRFLRGSLRAPILLNEDLTNTN
ncbi:hypothetical protein KR038_000816 [Drosophila bunnanda]|nr:hypothetical protein KR038_000816 [Drosophila bunnanda]